METCGTENETIERGHAGYIFLDCENHVIARFGRIHEFSEDDPPQHSRGSEERSRTGNPPVSPKLTIGVLVGGEVIGGLGTYETSSTQGEAGYNSTGSTPRSTSNQMLEQKRRVGK